MCGCSGPSGARHPSKPVSASCAPEPSRRSPHLVSCPCRKWPALLFFFFVGSAILADASTVELTTESAVTEPFAPENQTGVGAPVHSSCNKTDDNGTIRIGILITLKTDWKMILGAVPQAMVDANKSLPSGRKLCHEVHQAGDPASSKAIEHMTRWREEGFHAFIGPDISCHAEGLVATAWNLPLITYRCMDKIISNKTYYRSVARTIPHSTQVSEYVISLLKHFDWNHVYLVVGNDETYHKIEKTIKDEALSSNITINGLWNLPADLSSQNSVAIEAAVRETYKKTRIYIVIAHSDTVLDFLKELCNFGLLNDGKYMVISIDEENDEDLHMKKTTGEDIIKGSKCKLNPFRSLLKLVPKSVNDLNYDNFTDRVKVDFMKIMMGSVSELLRKTIKVPKTAAYLYDAIQLYAYAINKILSVGGDITNGTAVIKHLYNHHYMSIQGFNVTMDDKAESEGSFMVIAYNETQKDFTRVGTFNYLGNQSKKKPVLEIERIEWINGKPPLSLPVCGFENDLCETAPNLIGILVGVACGFIIILIFAFVIRYFSYERKLSCLLWKIDIKDLHIFPKELVEAQTMAYRSTMQIGRSSIFGIVNETHIDPVLSSKVHTDIAIYKGNIVAIRFVHKKSIDLTRSIRKELKQIRELRHDNLVPFIGACIDPPNICIVTAYCTRGSLEDVLENDNFNIDNMFAASLLSDLLKGMIYLHESEIISHGNLKSSNCLVDSRWVLQITDYGLHEFKSVVESRSLTDNRRNLWRAPELLRNSNPPFRGTQKGDVYSFGIILYEIIGRNGPWGTYACYSIKEITDRLINPRDFGKIFRPPIEELSCADYIITCLKECWHEEPDQRPDFRFIRQRLKDMQAGLKPNIFDNMMTMMEKHSFNLESLVYERTKQLDEEKKKTENLLLRMLPKSVAEQLKRGEPVNPESFDRVTISFSDIVGFTALCADSTPFEVVDLLNEAYTCFDSIISNFDVYKVETIGDAYMVVSGLPIRNHDTHAAEIAGMALRLLEAVKEFKIKHRPNELLKLRIGIHTGPCAAGVVGIKMPRYCLFGDTVNTASRLESTGEPLKIHVSEACKKVLDSLGGFILEERGMIPIKGKGEMRTHWLLSEVPRTTRHSIGSSFCRPDPIIPVSGRKMSTSLPRILECREQQSSVISAMTTTHDSGDSGESSSPSVSLPDSPNLSVMRCLLNDSLYVKPRERTKRLTAIPLQRLGGYSHGSCSNLVGDYRSMFNDMKWKNGYSVISSYKSVPTIDINAKENYV